MDLINAIQALQMPQPNDPRCKRGLVGAVEINDALGNNIYAGKIHMDGQTPFNTSTFAPGFYNVHVTNNANNQNFKLIICR